MKKKQLIAVFVMMLAAASMSTACLGSNKAEDALNYLDGKYGSTEDAITLPWDAGSDYDELTYDFLRDFSVASGFEMKVFADEDCTQEEDQSGLVLDEGINDFWIVVYKAGTGITDKSAYKFKVNVYKPETVKVTLNVNGETTEQRVQKGKPVLGIDAPSVPQQVEIEGWYLDEDCTQPYILGQLANSDFTLYAKVVDAQWSTDVKVMFENVEDDEYTAGNDVACSFTGAPTQTQWTKTYPGFTLSSFVVNPQNPADITAYYTRNEYTVTYVGISGEQLGTETVKYEGSIVGYTYAPEAEDINNGSFKFKAWKKGASEVGAITENCTLTPDYEITYTISKSVKGEVEQMGTYKVTDFAAGSVVTAPQAVTGLPKQEKFNGWKIGETIVESMACNFNVVWEADITAEGVWEADVKVKFENVADNEYADGEGFKFSFTGYVTDKAQLTKDFTGFVLDKVEVNPEDPSDITAYYKRERYTVKVKDIDGTVLETLTNIKYGATVNITANPTFGGDTSKAFQNKWEREDGSAVGAIDGNIDVYPVYIQTYSVTTVVNGVEIVVGSYNEGDVALNPGTPQVNKDQAFAGWYLDEECTIAFDATKVYNENITLYAKTVEGTATWQAEVKVLKQKLDGEYAEETITVNFTGYATQDKFASKAQAQIEGFRLVSFDAATLTATYERKAYTVTYVDIDGVEIGTEEVLFEASIVGKSYTLDSTAVKGGEFTLTGWSVSNKPVTADVVATPVYEIKYSITTIVDGKEKVTFYTVNDYKGEGATVNAPETPYDRLPVQEKFDGWLMDNAPFVAGKYKENLVLTASLSATDWTVAVNVMFENVEDEDYTAGKSVTKTFNGYITEETVFDNTYTGFTFEKIEATGEKKNVVTVYYKREVYTVTYLDIDGNAIDGASEQVKFEGSIVGYDYKPSADKIGTEAFDFISWNAPEKITENIELAPQYKITYTITTIVKGEETTTEYYVENFAEGAEVKAPAAPELPKQEKFDGWLMDDAAFVAGNYAKDIVLVAAISDGVWEAEVTVLKQKLDGEYAEETIKYEFTGYADDSKYNKEYTGFRLDSFDKDTLTAKYDRIVYTVTYLDIDGNAIDGASEQVMFEGSIVGYDYKPSADKIGSDAFELISWNAPEKITENIELAPQYKITYTITTIVKGEETTTEYYVTNFAEGAEVKAPAAPGLPKQEKFDGWLMDDAAFVAGNYAKNIVLVAAISDGEWATNVKVEFENVEDDNYTAGADVAYTFTGYVTNKAQFDKEYTGFTLDSLVAEGDVVTAKYKRNLYTVKVWDTNGSLIDTITGIKYQSTVDLSGYQPTLEENQEFANVWKDASGAVVDKITGDTEVFPSFDQYYNLKTIVKGEETTVRFIEGATIGVPADATGLPVQEKFEAWYIDEDCTIKFEGTTATKDITLYAKIVDGTWETTVNVMFENVEDDDFTAGEGVIYEFTGYINEDTVFDEEYEGFILDSLVADENNPSVVTASYKRIKYTVTYLDINGEAIEGASEEVKYEGSIVGYAYKPSVDEIGTDKFVLNGWLVDEEEVGSITGDVELTPSYTITYTVTVKVKGEVDESKSFEYYVTDFAAGEYIDAPEDPITPEQEEFLGWAVDGADFDFDSVYAEDIVLEAAFQETVWKATVKVMFENIEDNDYTAGASVEQFFDGYIEDKSEFTKVYTGFVLDELIVNPENPSDVTAYYKREVYTVTYTGVKGETVGTEEVKYGGKISGKDYTPADEDVYYGEYEFKGWSIADKEITKNETASVQYKITYTVTTIVKGESTTTEYYVENLSIGGEVKVPAAPELPDQEEFDGWKMGESTFVEGYYKGDIELVAQIKDATWTAIIKVMLEDLDGNYYAGVDKSQEVTGYVVNWKANKEGIPTKINVEVDGFTLNQVEVNAENPNDITAYFKRNTCVVSYMDINGEKFATKNYKFGQTLPAWDYTPDDIEVNYGDFDLKGWKDIEGNSYTTVPGNIALYPDYEVTYTISTVVEQPDGSFKTSVVDSYLVTDINAGTYVNKPQAPALIQQVEFDNWYIDPNFETLFTPGAYAENIKVYAKLTDGIWSASVKVNEEDENGNFVAKEPIDFTFTGYASQDQFVGIDAEREGFYISEFIVNPEDPGDVTVSYSRVSYEVVIYNADGTPFGEVINIKHGLEINLDAFKPVLGTDPEIVYTITGWVYADGTEVPSSTVRVFGNTGFKPVVAESERTYSFVLPTIPGVHYYGIEGNEGNVYKAGETLSFEAELDADYNRSTNYELVVSGATIARDGDVWTITFGGGADTVTLSAENLERNIYEVYLNAILVNTGAEFAMAKELGDVEVYVNGEKVEGFDYKVDRSVKVTSGESKIVIKAGSYASEETTINIEEGDNSLVYGGEGFAVTTYVGYYEFNETRAGKLDKTLDGLTNDSTTEKAFYASLLGDIETFHLSATFQSKGVGTNEGYGFIVAEGSDELKVIFNANGLVTVEDNEGKKISLGRAYDNVASIKDAAAAGLKLGVTQRGSSLFFYVEGKLQFVLNENGVSIMNTSEVNTSAEDSALASKIKNILGDVEKNIQVGLYVAGENTKVVIKDASYSSDENAINALFAQPEDILGSISFSANGITGSADVFVGKSSDYREVSFASSINLDSYAVYGKAVTLKFNEVAYNSAWGYIKNIVVYTTKDGVEDEGKAVELAYQYDIAEVLKWTEYSFVPQIGESYRFELNFVEKVDADDDGYEDETQEWMFAVKNSKAFVEGIVYEIYSTADGVETLVFTGTTGKTGPTNAFTSLAYGSYKIKIAAQNGYKAYESEEIVIDGETEAITIVLKSVTASIPTNKFTEVDGSLTATFSGEATAGNAGHLDLVYGAQSYDASAGTIVVGAYATISAETGWPGGAGISIIDSEGKAISFTPNEYRTWGTASLAVMNGANKTISNDSSTDPTGINKFSFAQTETVYIRAEITGYTIKFWYAATEETVDLAAPIYTIDLTQHSAIFGDENMPKYADGQVYIGFTSVYSSNSATKINTTVISGLNIDVYENALAMNNASIAAKKAAITAYANAIGADLDSTSVKEVIDGVSLSTSNSAAKLAIAKAYALNKINEYSEKTEATAIIEAMADYTALDDVLAVALETAAYYSDSALVEIIETVKAEAKADIESIIVSESELTAAATAYLREAQKSANAAIDAVLADNINMAEGRAQAQVAKFVEEAVGLVKKPITVTFQGSTITKQVKYGELVANIVEGVVPQSGSIEGGYLYFMGSEEDGYYIYNEGDVITEEIEIKANGIFTPNSFYEYTGSDAYAQGDGLYYYHNGYRDRESCIDTQALNTTVAEDATEGVFTSEYNVYYFTEWEYMRGWGHTIYQLSTGKSISLVLDSFGTGNRWGNAAYGDGPALRVVVNGENGISDSTTAHVIPYTNKPTSTHTFNTTAKQWKSVWSKIEVDGYTIKIWYGADSSAYNADKPTFVIDNIKELLDGTKSTFNGGESSFDWETSKDYFPYYAENDGKSDIVLGTAMIYGASATGENKSEFYHAIVSFKSHEELFPTNKDKAAAVITAYVKDTLKLDVEDARIAAKINEFKALEYIKGIDLDAEAEKTKQAIYAIALGDEKSAAITDLETYANSLGQAVPEGAEEAINAVAKLGDAQTIAEKNKLNVAKAYALKKLFDKGYEETERAEKLIDNMTDYNLVEEVLANAIELAAADTANKAVLDAYNAAVEQINAIVADFDLTDAGVKYLADEKAAAIASLDGITTETYEAAIESAIARAEAAKATVQSNVTVSFEGSDAKVEILWGSLVSEAVAQATLPTYVKYSDGVAPATGWALPENVTNDTEIKDDTIKIGVTTGTKLANKFEGSNGEYTGVVENKQDISHKDFLLTDVVADATKGVLVAEAYVNINHTQGWLYGMGISITQVSTGKSVEFRGDASYNNWDKYIFKVLNGSSQSGIGFTNQPSDENKIKFPEGKPDTDGTTTFVRVEIDGYRMRMWVGKDSSTIDLSRPTWDKVIAGPRGGSSSVIFYDDSQNFPKYMAEGEGHDIVLGFVAYYNGAANNHHTTTVTAKANYYADAEGVDGYASVYAKDKADAIAYLEREAAAYGATVSSDKIEIINAIDEAANRGASLAKAKELIVVVKAEHDFYLAKENAKTELSTYASSTLLLDVNAEEVAAKIGAIEEVAAIGEVNAKKAAIKAELEKFGLETAIQNVKDQLDAWVDAYEGDLVIEQEHINAGIAIIEDMKIADILKQSDILSAAIGAVETAADTKAQEQLDAYKTEKIEEIEAIGSDADLTDKAIEDLGAAKEAAKTAIGKAGSMADAVNTYNDEIAKVQALYAKVIDTYTVTFEGNQAITEVKYGTLLSELAARVSLPEYTVSSGVLTSYTGWNYTSDYVTENVQISPTSKTFTNIIAPNGAGDSLLHGASGIVSGSVWSTQTPYITEINTDKIKSPAIVNASEGIFTVQGKVYFDNKGNYFRGWGYTIFQASTGKSVTMVLNNACETISPDNAEKNKYQELRIFINDGTTVGEKTKCVVIEATNKDVTPISKIGNSASNRYSKMEIDGYNIKMWYGSSMAGFNDTNAMFVFNIKDVLSNAEANGTAKNGFTWADAQATFPLYAENDGKSDIFYGTAAMFKDGGTGIQYQQYEMKTTYTTYKSILEKEKTNAKSAISTYATGLGLSADNSFVVEALDKFDNEEFFFYGANYAEKIEQVKSDLFTNALDAEIKAAKESLVEFAAGKGLVTDVMLTEIGNAAKLGDAMDIADGYKLDIAIEYAYDQVDTYVFENELKDENGVYETAGAYAVIQEMKSYTELDSILTRAYAAAEFDHTYKQITLIKNAARKTIEEIVPDVVLSAAGKKEFDKKKAQALTDVNDIQTTSKNTAQSLANDAIALVNATKATVQQTYIVSVYTTEVTVVWGSLISEAVAQVELPAYVQDATGVALATGWKYTDAEVYNNEAVVEVATGTKINNAFTGENGNASAIYKGEDHDTDTAIVLPGEMTYTGVVANTTNNVVVASTYITYDTIGEGWHMGAGFSITQVLTGKSVHFQPVDYKTGGTIEACVRKNDSNKKIKISPTNPIEKGDANYIGYPQYSATYYIRMEVDGYNLKMWYGVSEETIDLSKPTYSFNVKDIFSAGKNAVDLGYSWSAAQEYFPFYEDATLGTDIVIGVVANYNKDANDGNTVTKADKMTVEVLSRETVLNNEKVKATTALNTYAETLGLSEAEIAETIAKINDTEFFYYGVNYSEKVAALKAELDVIKEAKDLAAGISAAKDNLEAYAAELDLTGNEDADAIIEEIEEVESIDAIAAKEEEIKARLDALKLRIDVAAEVATAKNNITSWAADFDGMVVTEEYLAEEFKDVVARGEASTVEADVKKELAKEWAIDQLDAWVESYEGDLEITEEAINAGYATINTINNTDKQSVDTLVEQAIAEVEQASGEGAAAALAEKQDELVGLINEISAGKELNENALKDLNAAKATAEAAIRATSTIALAEAEYGNQKESVEAKRDEVIGSYTVKFGDNEAITADYGVTYAELAARVSLPEYTVSSGVLTSYTGWNYTGDYVTGNIEINPTTKTFTNIIAPNSAGDSLRHDASGIVSGSVWSTQTPYITEINTDKIKSPAIVNASEGIFTVQGRVWFNNNGNYFRGWGYTIFQASTGKSVTMVLNNACESISPENAEKNKYQELRIFINDGTTVSEKTKCVVIEATNKNVEPISGIGNSATNRYSKMEIDGYNIKMWYGSSMSGFNDTNAMFVFNIKDVLSNAEANGTAKNGFTWADAQATFPLYAENDGKSDIFFGTAAMYKDGGTGIEYQQYEMKTTYTTYKAILEEEKTNAKNAIRTYATGLGLSADSSYVIEVLEMFDNEEFFYYGANYAEKIAQAKTEMDNAYQIALAADKTAAKNDLTEFVATYDKTLTSEMEEDIENAAYGKAQEVADTYKLPIAKEWAYKQLKDYCDNNGYPESDNAKELIKNMTVTAKSDVQIVVENACGVAQSESNQGFVNDKTEMIQYIRDYELAGTFTEKGAQDFETEREKALLAANAATDEQGIDEALAILERAEALVTSNVTVAFSGSNSVEALYGTKISEIAKYADRTTIRTAMVDNKVTYGYWIYTDNDYALPNTTITYATREIKNSIIYNSSNKDYYWPGGKADETVNIDDDVLYGMNIEDASKKKISLTQKVWFKQEGGEYRGYGYTIYQPATGKSVSFVLDNMYVNADRKLRVVLNGKGGISDLTASVVLDKNPDATNLPRNGGSTTYSKVEICGYNIKLWYNTSETWENVPMFEFNLKELFEETDLMEYFPYYAEGDDKSDIVLGLAALFKQIGTSCGTELLDYKYSSESYESIIKNGWDDANKDSYDYTEGAWYYNKHYNCYDANTLLNFTRQIVSGNITEEAKQEMAIAKQAAIATINAIDPETTDAKKLAYFNGVKAKAIRQIEGYIGTAAEIQEYATARKAVVDQAKADLTGDIIVYFKGEAVTTKFGTSLATVAAGVKASSYSYTNSDSAETLYYAMWDIIEGAYATPGAAVNARKYRTISASKAVYSSSSYGALSKTVTGECNTEALYLKPVNGNHKTIIDAKNQKYSVWNVNWLGPELGGTTVSKEQYRGSGYTIYQLSTGKSISFALNNVGWKNENKTLLRIFVNNKDDANNCWGFTINPNANSTIQKVNINFKDDGSFDKGYHYKSKMEIDGYTVKLWYVAGDGTGTEPTWPTEPMFTFNVNTIFEETSRHTSKRGDYNDSLLNQAKEYIPYYAEETGDVANNDIAIGFAFLTNVSTYRYEAEFVTPSVSSRN